MTAAALVFVAFALVGQASNPPRFEMEHVIPPSAARSHAPGIVECPNGDLLASWYSDPEGPRSDASAVGARKRKGENAWSKPFLMADRPGFADCNTTMWIDAKRKLWLFWPTIVGDSWESCLMNYRVSADYEKPGPPRWEREGLILLKPDDFRDEALKLLGNGRIRPPRGAKGGPDAQREKLGDPLFQRLGWAPRCKPTVLPSGRILLPLYTDTFAISIMAVSDDAGDSWYASKPLIGFGNIQPTVLRRNDGSLVAFMRENGAKARIRVSESKDDGLSWGPVGETSLPNPGSGIDGVRLANGHWILVYNDSAERRSSLAVSISEDEGRSWKFTRRVENHQAGRYHYPAVIQGRDGTIHVTYAGFIAAEPDPTKPKPKGEAFVATSIKHVSFNEEWIRAGN